MRKIAIGVGIGLLISAALVWLLTGTAPFIIAWWLLFSGVLEPS